MNNYFNIDNQFFNSSSKQDLDLYDPYEGFIRGNMYKNLYDPYKINSPYEIKPMNEQAEMLTRPWFLRSGPLSVQIEEEGQLPPNKKNLNIVIFSLSAI